MKYYPSKMKKVICKRL